MSPPSSSLKSGGSTSQLSAPIESITWKRFNAPTGAYAMPNKPWWAAQRYAITAEELEFNPRVYAFDSLIAKRSGFAHLGEALNLTDAEGLALRRNLSVLRNFLLSHLYRETPTNAAAERIALEQMAMHLAVMLKRGSSGGANLMGSFSAPGSAAVKHNVAVRERAGAAALYQTLWKLEHAPGTLRTILQKAGLTPRVAWGLPPIGETPFSPAHLAAILQENPHLQGKIEDVLPEEMRLKDGLETQEISADEAEYYQAVDALSSNVKRQAVEIAHEILRKLKMQFRQVPMDELLAKDPAILAGAFADMETILHIYDTYLTMAANVKPQILDDELIMEANTAIGKLLYQARHFALQQAINTKNIAQIGEMQKEMAGFPDALKQPGKETVDKVLDTVEKALGKVMGLLQEASVSAPGEAERARGGRKGHEISEDEVQLAALVGMGEEMQRLQATQQAAQKSAMQQAHIATQQQIQQRQQAQAAARQQRGQQTTQTDARRTQQGQQTQTTRTQANQQRLQAQARQLRLQQRLQAQQAKLQLDKLAGHHDHDFQHMRNSLNVATSGQLVQPGNAKDILRKERDRVEKPGVKPGAPAAPAAKDGRTEKSTIAPPPPPREQAPLVAHIEDVHSGPSSPLQPTPPRPPKRQSGR